MAKFKVGDIIKHTELGCHGIILGFTGFNDGGIRTYHTRWFDGTVKGSFCDPEHQLEHCDDYKLQDDEFEYKILKLISGEKILPDKPCQPEFDEAVKKFGFFSPPNYKELIDSFKKNPSWRKWLTEKGYISCIPRSKISIGDRVQMNEKAYIIAQISPHEIVLISLYEGNRWRDSVKVKDVTNISRQEFQLIVGPTQNIDEILRYKWDVKTKK